MKAKHGIAIFLIGLCLEFIALIFKFEHWPFVNMIVILAMLMKMAGLMVTAWKVLRYPGLQDFLDH